MPHDRSGWVDSQLFRCKNIDQLISDSEHPEKRLKKTLGWISLTALGIGAIIGTGIFVLTGTAAAGEEVLYPSQNNTPALSSYFELMDRLVPNFLSALSSQKIKGTRVLLK